MGLSNELSCEGGSFSCYRPTPTGVFTQRFEALFLGAGALGFAVCFAPHHSSGLSVRKCGVAGSASHHLVGVCQLQPGLPCSTIRHLAGSPSRCLAVSPLHPGCPSPPLLLVWMNVSSLSPWLSDFHTVRFSGSSGCFVFLNCCCPSFGCARRHSVSTYASILAGIRISIFYLVCSVEVQSPSSRTVPGTK